MKDVRLARLVDLMFVGEGGDMGGFGKQIWFDLRVWVGLHVSRDLHYREGPLCSIVGLY